MGAGLYLVLKLHVEPGGRLHLAYHLADELSANDVLEHDAALFFNKGPRSSEVCGMAFLCGGKVGGGMFADLLQDAVVVAMDGGERLIVRGGGGWEPFAAISGA